MEPERHPFIAAAELIDVQSETRVEARTSELSLHGCYLDMLNTLPVGTQLKLKVTHGNATFEALGTVVDSQPNMGMEVVFTATEPNNQVLLHKWLRQLNGE